MLLKIILFVRCLIQSVIIEACNVQGVPSLVLLDGETGVVISDRAAEWVEEDPEGIHYPWETYAVDRLN